MRHGRLITILLGLLFTSMVWAGESIHHNMSVNILPSTGQIHVRDHISIPLGLSNKPFSFYLNSNLKLVNSSADLKPVGKPRVYSQLGISVKQYRVTRPTTEIHLEYSGQIQNKLSAASSDNGEELQDTSGIISTKGVFLASSSAWYPIVDDYLVTFNLDISTPSNWTTVSQGVRTAEMQESKLRTVSWKETQAQDDIYIIGGQYNETVQTNNNLTAMVYLSNSDKELAGSYIDATFRYVDMYQKLLGTYPYGKFALIENFWESGYGMPSFTLLGPRIIRFPFILYTSYPHEILHNWWGNGVYVDYEKGNWAEGLTAYLSDHLLKAQRGQGSNYRRDVLQKYTDYVQETQEFPLSSFQSRHSTASEAIGYGKTMMLFHMLRVELGDKKFVEALRDLYQEYKFKKASYEDIRRIFERHTQRKMAKYFNNWVTQTGSADLRLDKVTRKNSGKGHELSFELTQNQKGVMYELNVPVALWLKDQDVPELHTLKLNKRSKTFTLKTKSPVDRLHVDPKFDVFRRLHRSEIPAALSQGFGAPEKTIILPHQASEDVIQAYKKMAETWAATQPGNWNILMDNEVEKLPLQRAIWLLGWENQFRSDVERSTTGDLDFATIGMTESGTANSQSIVIATDNKRIRNQTLLWVGSQNVSAIKGLTRKLPHYKKYGYLAFDGDEPTNVIKTQWQTKKSPLIHNFNSRRKNYAPVKDRKALAPSVWN